MTATYIIIRAAYATQRVYVPLQAVERMYSDKRTVDCSPRKTVDSSVATICSCILSMTQWLVLSNASETSPSVQVGITKSGDSKEHALSVIDIVGGIWRSRRRVAWVVSSR